MEVNGGIRWDEKLVIQKNKKIDKTIYIYNYIYMTNSRTTYPISSLSRIDEQNTSTKKAHTKTKQWLPKKKKTSEGFNFSCEKWVELSLIERNRERKIEWSRRKKKRIPSARMPPLRLPFSCFIIQSLSKKKINK